MLGHGICSGGRVDRCRVSHDMDQGDPALSDFSVPVCPMKTEVCSPSKKREEFFLEAGPVDSHNFRVEVKSPAWQFPGSHVLMTGS